jgi:hypothetical protein
MVLEHEEVQTTPLSRRGYRAEAIAGRGGVTADRIELSTIDVIWGRDRSSL